MWQKKQAPSISARNERFWIEFHNLARDPNSHAWNIQWLFRSNRLPFIPTHGSGPPQATVGPYAHPMCKTYICSATTWPYSCPLCGTYSRTSVRVKNNQITSGGGYVHSSGRSVTRLAAYHIYGMWLVLSNTWPHLPHTTILSAFINTDGVTFQVMILHITPSIILIVIAE
jgi:hypothetical protein